MTQAVHTEPSEAGNRWLIGALGIIWAIILALALVGFSRAGMLPEGPDEWSYDWRTLLFSPTAKTPNREIAVLLIDEDSSPITTTSLRSTAASWRLLLRAIDASNPKAIGLDFIYDRKSEPAKTQKLIDALRTVKAPIVFGAIDLRIRALKEEIKYQEDFIARTGREAGHVFFARDVNKLKIARSGRTLYGRTRRPRRRIARASPNFSPRRAAASSPSRKPIISPGSCRHAAMICFRRSVSRAMRRTAGRCRAAAKLARRAQGPHRPCGR